MWIRFVLVIIRGLELLIYLSQFFPVGHLVEAFTHVVNVHLGNGSNADSAIVWKVYGMVINHFLYHGLSQSCVGEHTDLVHNMIPVVGASKSLQLFNHLLSVVLQSVGHCDDFSVPFLLQLFVAQNLAHNSCSVDRRVGVLWKTCVFKQSLHLKLFFVISANHTEAACSLTVESKVLGERLGKHDSAVVLSEIPETPGVFIVVIVSKTLIG